MPTLHTDRSTVTAVPPAPAERAVAHFAGLLAFETDCADVRAATVAGTTTAIDPEPDGAVR